MSPLELTLWFIAFMAGCGALICLMITVSAIRAFTKKDKTPQGDSPGSGEVLSWKREDLP